MKTICIVGGGIAGLYAGNILQKKGYDITIFEKYEILGGRIQTYSHDGETMEAGAGRFNKNHKLLFNLLKDQGFIYDDLYAIPSKQIYIKDDTIYDIPTTRIIKMVIDKSKSISIDHLKSITLKMFMKEFLADSFVDDFIYSFGYTTEFESMNAYDAINIFEKDFIVDIEYFIINGGLTRLINNMYNELKQNSVKIFTKCEVISHLFNGKQSKIEYIKNGKVNNAFYDHVVFCTTKPALENINGLNDNILLKKTLTSLGIGSLYRIYAKFPKYGDTVWFQDLPKITTNNALRYIIPINPKTGLIMISYTDGINADMWVDVQDIQKNLMLHLRKLFPSKNIPEPVWIKQYYWKVGMHYWKPNPKKYINTKDLLAKYNYLVCGEVVSKSNHGWIEGSLDSVKKALRLL